MLFGTLILKFDWLEDNFCECVFRDNNFNFVTMVQNLLKDYIVKTQKKSGATNNLCYCKACYTNLGENHPELKTIADKTERILKHFKTCQNFQTTYSQAEKDKIFSLDKKQSNINIYLLLLLLIIINRPTK
jgi:hypothetical protein